jgi:hypothetical protein
MWHSQQICRSDDPPARSGTNLPFRAIEGVRARVEDGRTKSYRDTHFGKLDKALDAAKLNNWTVVSMKDDWKRIFKFQ